MKLWMSAKVFYDVITQEWGKENVIHGAVRLLLDHRVHTGAGSLCVQQLFFDRREIVVC